MDKPKISIITVCYNSEAHLEEAMLSIINQSYANKEYIVIDGGSKDNTLAIIDKYRDKIDYFVSEPDKASNMDSDRPATRAEVTAILYNMMEQAKLNPNAKLAEAMRKKTGEGYVIENAFVQGAVGTIPAGSLVPIKVGNVMGSQISKNGDQFIAKTPQHYITKDKYILIYKGTDVKGQVCQARPGKLFVRNGILTLSTDTMVTPNDQAVIEHGTADVTVKKSKFMTWIRKIFKGEKIMVLPDGTVYVKLLDTIKVDLTNGGIFE